MKILGSVQTLCHLSLGVPMRKIPLSANLNFFFPETLRFFPPMGGLIRSTTANCTLPLTDVKLSKNTSIAIPIMGFHMDPQYFPDPEKFDPERFSEEQKATRPPYVYMPFGDGPRICIGRFLSASY